MPLRTGAEVVLSTSAYEVAWVHAGLGEMPIVIYVPPRGFEPGQRQAVIRDGFAELQRLGLADRGRLHPDLADSLALLARPRHAVDLRMGTDDGEVRALAAAAGDLGVLAQLAGGRLRLRPVRGSSIVREIVALLPDHPAGPGTAVSLPRDQIEPAARAAGSSPYAFADALIQDGTAIGTARALARMIDGPIRRGQFGAAVRDRDGTRRPAPRVVAFHDTQRGRFLIEEKRSPDGRIWTTVAPADSQRLGQHLARLLDELG